MTLAEIFSTPHELAPADKLRAIQFLADDLLQQPEMFFESGASYPIWSPYDADDTAAKLIEMLQSDE